MPNEEILPDDGRLQECPMVGDVNLFLSGDLVSLAAPLDLSIAAEEEQSGHAEVEIMIAGTFYTSFVSHSRCRRLPRASIPTPGICS